MSSAGIQVLQDGLPADLVDLVAVQTGRAPQRHRCRVVVHRSMIDGGHMARHLFADRTMSAPILICR
ncbi:MAG: hypothetical protein JWP76_2878 [Dactylosporangium sp.]|nr:hypothetical protein [Dactylosporangium sp.]